MIDENANLWWVKSNLKKNQKNEFLGFYLFNPLRYDLAVLGFSKRSDDCKQM